MGGVWKAAGFQWQEIVVDADLDPVVGAVVGLDFDAAVGVVVDADFDVAVVVGTDLDAVAGVVAGADLDGVVAADIGSRAWVIVLMATDSDSMIWFPPFFSSRYPRSSPWKNPGAY